MNFREEIRLAVDISLKVLREKPVKYQIEHPADMSHGDYSVNVALVVGGGRPLAEKIAENLKKSDLNKIASEISVAGPGFINISIRNEALITLIDKLLRAEYLGVSGKGKKVIVEYSSPNIAKPFTVGHLRSTIIGDAIANILESIGWTVLRDNHLGDWGTQFGKQICALKKWGDVNRLDYSVKELVDLYVKFHEEAEKDPKLEDEARSWFKKLEDGDKEARALWQKCVDWSWIEFNKIYQRLGIKFSDQFNQGRGLGESFFEDKMTDVIAELKAKKLLKTGEDGAQLVFFKDEKYPPAMILKKDGATLYATRDLATDKYRKEKYNPDLVINEVGQEQELYFKQLFEIETRLGWYKKEQRIHVAHGMYRFKEGKMSTRKGNVIWLEEVLDEAEKKATAKEIAIGALKWNDLKGSAKRDIVFDWDEILNMEGNSGPYLQYTYARCRSVIAKSNSQIDPERSRKTTDLTNPDGLVLRTLYRFDEVVTQAAEELSPSLVANFLYDLAQRYNNFYNVETILKAPVGKKEFRLWLTHATAEILKKGLYLLGIEVPSRM